jgi:hypothetical protein
MIEATKFCANPLQDQIDLIDKLNAVLEKHPCGANFKLLIVDDSLQISSDEVLVQELDSENRRFIVKPIKISSLSTNHDIYDINKIDLNDGEFIESMKNEINLDASKVPKCIKSYNPPRHHYD